TRLILQPHPGLYDHTQRAFRADNETVRARTSTRTRQAARFHGAGRGNGAGAFDEIVDMGVEGGEVPARPGRDPASEGRELEALRIVPGRKTVWLQPGLDRGAAHSALDARGAAGPVDFNDAVEAAQIEADGARVAIADHGLNATDD